MIFLLQDTVVCIGVTCMRELTSMMVLAASPMCFHVRISQSNIYHCQSTIRVGEFEGDRGGMGKGRRRNQWRRGLIEYK